MTAIIAGLISFLPEVPGLIESIQKLIARGKVIGELSPEQADALTALARWLPDEADRDLVLRRNPARLLGFPS